MSRIKGAIYIVAHPEMGPRGTYEYTIHNEGDTTLIATHNIVAQRGGGGHDDHGHFGHGLKVPASGTRTSQQFFDASIPYNGLQIQPGAIFRAGARYLFWQEVPLPPMQKNAAIKIPFDNRGGPDDQVQWQSREAAQNMDQLADANHQNYAKRDIMHVGVQNGASLVAELERLTGGGKEDKGPKPHGEFSITAIKDARGHLSHWEIKFENDGKGKEKTPFIGTVAFEGVKNKNEGLGLEAMACPEPGSSAIQRIEANGNYGVMARPGVQIRAGVRGRSSLEGIELPREGKVKHRVEDFIRQADAAVQPEFFDLEAVKNKRAEKLDKVRFFLNGKPLNDEIKPVTYAGGDAVAESDHRLPEIRVRYAEKGAGGVPGWWVSITNLLEERFPDKFPGAFPPNFADAALQNQPLAGQPKGFVATLRIGDGGNNAEHMRSKAFRKTNEERIWFVPEGMQAKTQKGKVVAEEGVPLTVGTRGMGMFVRIPLSKRDVVVNEENPKLYRFRPDQVAAANLTQVFAANLKDVADPDPNAPIPEPEEEAEKNPVIPDKPRSTVTADANQADEVFEKLAALGTPRRLGSQVGAPKAKAPRGRIPHI